MARRMCTTRIGVALSFVLVACAFALPGAAYAVVTPHADLPSDGLVVEAVHETYAAGVMRGSGEYFRPDESATRAHLAAVLGRLDGWYGLESDARSGVSVNPGTSAFTAHFGAGASGYDDVDAGAYYRGDLVWAKQAGVLAYAGALFMPQTAVTVDEALVAFRTLALLEGGPELLDRFDGDVDTVFGRHTSYLAWVPEEGERGRAVTRSELAMLAAQLIAVNPYFDGGADPEWRTIGIVECASGAGEFASMKEQGVTALHPEMIQSAFDSDNALRVSSESMSVRAICPSRLLLIADDGTRAILEVRPQGASAASIVSTAFW